MKRGNQGNRRKNEEWLQSGLTGLQERNIVRGAARDAAVINQTLRDIAEVKAALAELESKLNTLRDGGTL